MKSQIFIEIESNYHPTIFLKISNSALNSLFALAFSLFVTFFTHASEHVTVTWLTSGAVPSVMSRHTFVTFGACHSWSTFTDVFVSAVFGSGTFSGYGSDWVAVTWLTSLVEETEPVMLGFAFRTLFTGDTWKFK